MAAANDGRVPFAQMAGRLKPQLLKALATMELTHMTPVQEKVLQLPSFTQDCLVQAKTGTGKTIAFLLPALQSLLAAKNLQREYVGLLVLAPTRELAQQIADECDRLTQSCDPPLECHLAVGGSKKKAHLTKFLNGKPTILVATPGRLIDYLSEAEPRERLGRIRCLVLDEADRMLDQGFMPALIQILKQIPPKSEAGWQGMCFSATVPPEINKVLHLVLNKDHARISTIDKDEVPTIDTVPQSLIPVASVDDALPTLHSLLSCAKADNPALKAVIFCPTARHAGLLYHVFGSTGGAAPPKLPVFQMQSRMAQAARTRTVEEFKATDRGLLFASDVVGRGMDFPDIDLVVQMGVPSDKEQYVHRVGRTGRAGKGGRAVIILAPEEMWFVKNNPEFPIENVGTFTHPKASAYPSAEIVKKALAKVPAKTREQAYVSNLGFIKSLMKHYRVDAPAVVALGNDFARAIGFDELPALPQALVSKMGLKGVPGLVIEGKGTAGGAAPAQGWGRGQARLPREPVVSGSNSVPVAAAAGARGARRQGGAGAGRGRGLASRAGAAAPGNVESAGASGQTAEPKPKRPRR